jgi:hypothetical protein
MPNSRKKEPSPGNFIAVRVDDNLKRRIAAYRDRLRAQVPGAVISDSSAIRALILSGLAAEKQPR